LSSFKFTFGAKFRQSFCDLFCFHDNKFFSELLFLNHQHN
jgi:hypothetical protein